MVRRNQAVKAARQFNQSTGDAKAIVVDDERWDAGVRVSGMRGTFTPKTNELISELSACFKIQDDELYLF